MRKGAQEAMTLWEPKELGVLSVLFGKHLKHSDSKYEESGRFHNTSMKTARVDENVASLFFYAFQFETFSP